MTSPLENLAGAGKPLSAESPDVSEFAGLKRSGLAGLKDAQIAANSLEGRFDLAYNAAHALSLAAVGGDSNRVIWFPAPGTLRKLCWARAGTGKRGSTRAITCAIDNRSQQQPAQSLSVDATHEEWQRKRL